MTPSRFPQVKVTSMLVCEGANASETSNVSTSISSVTKKLDGLRGIGPAGELTVALPRLFTGFAELLTISDPTVIDSPANWGAPSMENEVSRATGAPVAGVRNDASEMVVLFWKQLSAPS